MAGRTPPTAGGSSSLRVEILKELQSLLDDRDVRDRLDRGPLGETKGREHWVLHLLLRAQESSQAHVDVLIGSAYSNLAARLQAIDDRVERVEGTSKALGDEMKTRLEGVENQVAQRVSKEISTGVETAGNQLAKELWANLDKKWKPIGESIEVFSVSASQLTKDLSDTYRVATQSRLLLNENARRIIDLGRDLVALEESLKLALAKTLEDGLQPLEERISALEARLGMPSEEPGSNGRTDAAGGA
jgi:tetrahydromethanopterin S-methyltransferase subunit G/BMFP domain-containing protein YqiC